MREKKWAQKSFEDIQKTRQSFPLFIRLTAKTHALTVSDIFAKQLLQILNVGPTSVKVILQKYPTLRSLRRAYHGASTETEKKELLANLGDGRQKVGKRISEAIYRVYNEFKD